MKAKFTLPKNNMQANFKMNVIPDVRNFATKDELQTEVETRIEQDGILTTRIDEVESSIPDISNLATKSELQEVENEIPDISNLVTNSQLAQNLENYYTKTQTYSKTEVNQLIADIPKFRVEIVNALPVTGEPMVLYLVPKEGDNPDVYTEYVWIATSQNYELIGTTAVDLTGYLQTGDNISELNNDANYTRNIATGTNALTILGTASASQQAINIGQGSIAGGFRSTSFGANAQNNGQNAMAIGYGAKINSSGTNSIQIGSGTTTAPNQFNVGFNGIDNYLLLDGTTGLIPDARLSDNIATKEDLSSAVEEAEINAASYSDIIIPDTTNMKVLKTFEYDLSTRSWHAFATILNTLTTSMDYRLSTLFRITVTGEDINSVYEVLFSFRGLSNGTILTPFIAVRNTSESYTSAGSGLQQLRLIYPKVLGTTYNTYFELYPPSTIERHIKIEVLKDNSNIEWYDTLAATTINTNNQNTTNITIGTTQGPVVNTALPFSVSVASTAAYSTSFVSKIIGTCDLSAGEALPAGLTFASGDNIYGITNTTQPIDTEWGINYCPTTVANNVAITYTYFRQKSSFFSTTTTLPPHDAFDTLGLNLYLRCNLVNGQIYSDNYIATSISGGYTWYYLGKVTRTTNGYVAFDTTSSFFFTLDANGNMTHINGIPIAQSANTLTVGNTTITEAQLQALLNMI